MNRVDGKVAMVTGGGSGIGRTAAEFLAAAGADIVVSDINVSAADETAALINKAGGKAIAVEHDVSSEASWNHVMNQAIETYQQLNILVNNAGLYKALGCAETSLDEWQTIMRVNSEGVFLGVKSAVRVMAESKAKGSIINIASVNGLDAGASELCVAYCVSKAGVRQLSRCVALECGRKGYDIRINSICPGGVNTPMGKSLGEEVFEARQKSHPIGRGAEPEDIASAILYLASDDSAFITGTDLVVDGAVTAGFVSGIYPSE